MERKSCLWIFFAAMTTIAAVLGAPVAQAQTATTTTLTASASPVSSVTSGTVVTFTAAVSNGSPVTAGTVTFCNAAAPYCLNAPALIGTAQLTSAGTAVIRLVPGIGIHSYTAVFKANTSNATSTSSAQPLRGDRAVPHRNHDFAFRLRGSLHANATGSDPESVAVGHGTALSSTQLDATASAPGTGSDVRTAPAAVAQAPAGSLPGTYVYNPAAGTIPSIGSDTLSVTFTPTDSTDYNTATVTLVVNSKATPTINWPRPAAIELGTALSSTQLDVTASWPGGVTVPGKFVYTPAAGTTPAIGTDTLAVTFTPTDTTDYNTAAASVTLTVVGFTLTENSGTTTQQVTAVQRRRSI
jgi:hypothetical protein